MTTITYRGVKYDAEQYKAKVLAEAAQARNHELIYRGLKVQKKLTVVQDDGSTTNCRFNQPRVRGVPFFRILRDSLPSVFQAGAMR